QHPGRLSGDGSNTVHLQHRRRGLGSSLRRRQHAVRRRHRWQPLRADDQLAAGATRWVSYAVVRGQPVISVLVAAGFAVAACGGGSGSVGTSTSGTSGSTSAPGGTSSSTSATTRYTSAKATVIGKSTHVVVNHATSATLK